MKRGCGEYISWGGYVPDFALPEVRSAFAAYHRRSVMFGLVDGFKLDECDGSDYTGGWSFPNCARFPSGLDGEQYHSLFGILYMQTMLEALDGTPTLSEVRSSGALAAGCRAWMYRRKDRGQSSRAERVLSSFPLDVFRPLFPSSD